MLAQPLQDAFERRHRTCLGALPLLCPATQLPLEIPRSTPETLHPHRPPVNCMQGRQGIHCHLADLPALVEVVTNVWRDGIAYDNPSLPLHQIKRHANDRQILAEYDWAWHGDIRSGQSGQHPELPSHIMRCWQRRPQWWAPYDPLLLAHAQQIGEIGVPAAKLLHLQSALGIG